MATPFPDMPPPPGAPAPRTSTAQAIAGGFLIPLLAAPRLLIFGLVVALFARSILSDVLNRPVGRFEMAVHTPGKGMVFGFILTFVTGFAAVAAAGAGLVKLLFRQAAPRLLFRIGAAVLLAVAAAFWVWATRGQGVGGVDATIIVTGGWLGALLGMGFAASDPAALKVKRRRPPPRRGGAGQP